MSISLSRKEVIEKKKKAFAPPTERQLRMQSRAAAMGGLSPTGLIKWRQKTGEQRKHAIEREESRRGLVPSSIKLQSDFLKAKERHAKGIDLKPKQTLERKSVQQNPPILSISPVTTQKSIMRTVPEQQKQK